MEALGQVRTSMGNSVEGKKPVSRGERIRAGLFLLVFGLPVACGIAWLLFSTPINRVLNHPEQCTIEESKAASSGSKSYSGSYYVAIKTSDCGILQYKGSRHGLSQDEVADRINDLAGRTVSVDVGIWQLPYSATDIVGIEGLDLSQ